MSDDIEAGINELLPCIDNCAALMMHGEHHHMCPAAYRPAVADFCRKAVAEKDARIAELGLECVNLERELGLAQAEIEEGKND